MKHFIQIFMVVSMINMFRGQAEAQKSIQVTIDSVPQGASIYLEDKAAGALGTTPHRFTLKQGSYTFILEAEGYESFSRAIKVDRSTTFTFSLIKKGGPSTLVVEAAAGSGVAGAEIKINGKAAGNVPLALQVQSGRYLVEVSKQGYETWSEWIDIQKSERRAVLVNLVKTAVGTGTVLVASNIMGAEVFVEGKRADTAPALLEKLTPGKRIVEVRAKGYLAQQKEVIVEEGKTIKVTLELQPDQQTVASSSGTLQILASHKNVEILVDGAVKGMAPVKVEGLAEGSHVIEGRSTGLVPAEQTVQVKKGEIATIKLALKEMVPARQTGAIRVISPVLGAPVYIDGSLAGKTPMLRSQLDPGPHFVTVRREGYDELVQTVEVKPGEVAELQAVLTPSTKAVLTPSTKVEEKQTRPPAETAQQPLLASGNILGLSSYGAHLVGPSYFAADASLGFPYLFEGRLTTGFFSQGTIGMDGGVEFRTYGAISEIGLHTKLRLLERSPLALALLLSLGGGGGPSSRNTAYANLGIVTSVWFKQLVTFSGRAFFNFYTDRLCPSTANPGEVSACRSPQNDLTPTQIRERFAGTRFFLSALLEIPVHQRVNLFFILEGAPFQGNRLAYSDRFADIMPDSDPALYFRLGATFKY